MEQNELLEKEKTGHTGPCINCNHPVVEPGYPTALCEDCRKKFINFPIPVSIKIFGIGIALVIVFAMSTAFKNLSAGLHYEKGRNAFHAKKYFTAEHELNIVSNKIPGFAAANEYLALASFYNHDMNRFADVIKGLQGKEVEDEDLFVEINGIIEKAANYFPSDSFMVVLNKYGATDSIPEPVLTDYLTHFHDELFPRMRYISLLFDKNEYGSCDSLLNEVLAKDATFVNALALKTSVKRVTHQYDSAIYYCDKLLFLNLESTYAMASKAKTLLRQKKDLEGLKWAKKGVEIDGSDGYALATLALAYHYNNNPAERDRLLKQLKKDSVDIGYAQYTLDVMSGKEEFRD